MTKPKFTDTDKWQRPYVRSESTDVSKTWALARKKLEEEAKERAEKVKAIRVIGKKA